MDQILHVDADGVRDGLSLIDLVDALEHAFAVFDRYDVPDRHHHGFDGPDGSTSIMLLMPAWEPGGRAGVKLANIFPTNPARNLPAVTSLYILQSAENGRILATIDGAELTRLRTAAASAAAARRLSRTEARTLLMVGAGALAEPLIRAHSAIRPIEEVLLWNRSRDRAERLAGSPGARITLVDDLDAAVRRADVITCATMSTKPLIRSEFVQPGTHVDLVGAYRPDMRESDSALIARASVFVDTRPGALEEAGDLVIPIGEGTFDASNIVADLHELCSGKNPGRRSDDEVTLFKSVGHALEDLVAASLVFDRVRAA